MSRPRPIPEGVARMRAYRVTFPYLPAERLELHGVVMEFYRVRVGAWSWEHAILQAAADAPPPLASRVLACIRREAVEVVED